MPLLLFAAASFACVNPSHSDGDNIRCANIDGAMRLHGIDAPEMPGSCRPGRDCTPGDPYASRDHLRSLTRGRAVACEQVDTDNYGRRVVECRADDQNIACAMIDDGYAVQRYGAPDCGGMAAITEAESDWPAGEPPRPGRVDPPAPPKPQRPRTIPRVPDEPGHLATLPPLPPAVSTPSAPPVLAIFWFGIINALGFGMMAIDKARSQAADHRRMRRIPESWLLFIAVIGGSLGVTAGQQLFRHKTLKQPFARNLLIITGVQVGILLGILWLGR